MFRCKLMFRCKVLSRRVIVLPALHMGITADYARENIKAGMKERLSPGPSAGLTLNRAGGQARVNMMSATRSHRWQHRTCQIEKQRDA